MTAVSSPASWLECCLSAVGHLFTIRSSFQKLSAVGQLDYVQLGSLRSRRNRFHNHPQGTGQVVTLTAIIKIRPSDNGIGIMSHKTRLSVLGRWPVCRPETWSWRPRASNIPRHSRREESTRRRAPLVPSSHFQCLWYSGGPYFQGVSMVLIAGDVFEVLRVQFWGTDCLLI